MDDDSSDESCAIVERCAARDPRIRLFRRSHQGHTRLLNEALTLARGEYLARLDSDDIAMPTRLAAQAGYLDAHPECVAVGCWAICMDEDDDDIGRLEPPLDHDGIDASHIVGWGGAILHPGVMIRADSMRAVAGYNPDLEPAEDLDLFLRLAEIGHLANIGDHLIRYRRHCKQVSHARQSEQDECTRRAVEQARRRRGLPAIQLKPWLMTNALWQVHRTCAITALRYGYRKSAWKHTWRAFALRPWSPRIWKTAITLAWNTLHGPKTTDTQPAKDSQTSQ